MEQDFPFNIVPHTVPVFPLREYPHALIDPQNGLFLKLKQYIPVLRAEKPLLGSEEDAVTIIAAGGIGFIKELYEPLFAELLMHAHKAGFNIRAIWMADPVNIGESAVANRANLGCDPHWWDHARDLSVMMLHFSKEMIRPIMGLGHSKACNQLAYLSLWHPLLFSSFAFIEAGLDPEYGKGVTIPWAWQTLHREEKFATREQGQAALEKAYRTATWDRRVISRLHKHGIYLAQDQMQPEWRITTSKFQEVGSVIRINSRGVGLGSGGISDMTLEDRVEVPDADPKAWVVANTYRPELKPMWDFLPNLRPWVLYVNGENSPFFGRASTREKRARVTGTGYSGSGGMKLGAVEQVVIAKGQHTMVFDENISKVASHVAKWMGKEMCRWQHGEKVRRENWQMKSMQEKQATPKALVDAIRGEMIATKKSKL